MGADSARFYLFLMRTRIEVPRALLANVAAAVVYCRQVSLGFSCGS